jgi:hypothetical protein
VRAGAARKSATSIQGGLPSLRHIQVEASREQKRMAELAEWGEDEPEMDPRWKVLAISDRSITMSLLKAALKGRCELICEEPSTPPPFPPRPHLDRDLGVWRRPSMRAGQSLGGWLWAGSRKPLPRL